MSLVARKTTRGDIWYVRISAPPDAGRTTRDKWIRVGKSKLQAQRLEEKLNRERVDRRYGLVSSRTFAEYAERWFITSVEPHVKPSTLRSYRWAYERHLKPRFGDLPLSQITRDAVRLLVAELHQAGFAPKAIRVYCAPLSILLRHAQQDGLIGHNPFLGVYRGRTEHARTPATAFSYEQVNRLLTVAKERFTPQDYLFILILSMTGVRDGEAVALRWSDLLPEHNAIIVARTYDPEEGEEHSTKSRRARRVEVEPSVMQALLAWREQSQGQSGARVFRSKQGGVLHIAYWRKMVWKPLLAAAGIPYVKIHTLRHTYASLLLDQGASILYVKEQLGHGSVRVTLDLYGHLIPHRQTPALTKLWESVFSP